jgi:hypothetical protein
MKIAVKQAELRVANMPLRAAMKDGAAALAAVPQVFLRLTLEVDGAVALGYSAEVVMPKWFGADPRQPFRDELADVFHVIESACGFAEQVTAAAPADSMYDLWQRVYMEQAKFAMEEEYSQVMGQLGLSVMERALIDGVCRAAKAPFGGALRRNVLGIQLGELHKDLMGTEPANFLSAESAASLHVTHTVALHDPLTDDEGQMSDGLPWSLAASVAAYGLTHFNVQLSGDAARDTERLKKIAELVPRGSRFALDGRERFTAVEALREYWTKLGAEPRLATVMENLLWLEQPLTRATALSAETEEAMDEWETRPAMVIDESDISLQSMTEALGCDYAGASHRSSKGIVKAIANACLLGQRRRSEPGRALVMGMQGLAATGPVGVVQDLSLAAALGVTHIGLKGHHYFRGLGMMTAAAQQKLVAVHGDLFATNAAGFAALKIAGGKVDVAGVAGGPFGPVCEMAVEGTTAIDEWEFESLAG